MQSERENDEIHDKMVYNGRMNIFTKVIFIDDALNINFKESETIMISLHSDWHNFLLGLFLVSRGRPVG